MNNINHQIPSRIMYNTETNKRFIIGVDLDVVSADYYHGLRTHLQKTHNLTDEELLRKFPDPESYNMGSWEFPTTFYDTHTQAVEEGLYSNLQMIEGAADVLWKLSNDDFHIRIITSRFVSHGQHAKVLCQTAEWLDKYNIPYRDIMFVSRKTDIFADLYVDDSPENIHNFHKHNRDVIIFDTLYNKDIEGLHAQKWEQVYEYAHQLRDRKNMLQK